MIGGNIINILTAVKKNIYHVAIYIRLSKEDEDKKGMIKDSNSVQNQKSFLENYIKELGYELVDIYIDDGFTGTNFERPAFKRMIQDIEKGRINMVITKDLSRLGRDYIETGEYVEKYFPSKNVRYVSVLDNIDTFFSTSNNDIAPFKAVINDMYSRDNSKKIRTALRTLQEDGKWVGGCAPLGYMQDPENKNHLVINEAEAPIIRRIFAMAKSGLTYYQIKEILTQEKVPTASILRKKHSNTPMANDGVWCSKTVKTILQNQLYVGDLVQNRRSRISYKIRKMVKNDESEWVIVKNTHEPLVDRKTFEEVQKILSNCKVRSKKDIYRLFDGMLYCYECKRKISICKPRKSDNRTYICCNTYRMYSKLNLCTSHNFNYDVLEDAVLKKIKSIFQTYLDQDKIKNRVKSVCDKELSKNEYKMKFESLNNQVLLKEEQLDKMYLDKLDSKITEEMFNRIKLKLEIEINKIKNEMQEINELMENKEDSENMNLECMNLVKEFLNVENPNRTLILKLIQKIEITKNKEVNIYFNFKKLNFLLEENNH